MEEEQSSTQELIYYSELNMDWETTNGHPHKPNHPLIMIEKDAVCRPFSQPRVKDHVLLKDQFLIEAQDSIAQIMVEHSEEFLGNPAAIFEDLMELNANPSKAERNLSMVKDVSPAALLNLIIHKTKKVYNKVAKLEANRESEEIRKHTTDMLQKIQNLEAAQSEEAKQVAKDELALEKTCWINHIRNAEIKNRERIDTFVRNESRQMSSTTF